jgi:hypothetical protein
MSGVRRHGGFRGISQTGVSKMAEIFAAVDLSAVATFFGAAGVLIVGIALAGKGISLAKRLVAKA